MTPELAPIGGIGRICAALHARFLPKHSPSKHMKKLLIGCGGLIALIFVGLLVAFFTLDDTFRVERELEIKASPQAVYDTISDLKTWPEWSVWNKEADPGATWEFTGAESGDTATWTWSGEELGNGELILRDCKPGESIAYDMAFDDGDFNFVGSMTITPSGEGSKVSWVNNGQLPGAMKLMGPFIDSLSGPMYEDGLQGLKERLESAK